jgi:hypothetical protein
MLADGRRGGRPGGPNGVSASVGHEPTPGAGVVRQPIASDTLHRLRERAADDPEHGRVAPTLTADDREAVVGRADNGVGIGPKTLPCVFDLFAQAGPRP